MSPRFALALLAASFTGAFVASGGLTATVALAATTAPATRGPDPVINPTGVNTALPLYRTGTVVGCLPAGAGDGGCLTNAPQIITGKKSFTGGVDTSSVDSGVVMQNGVQVASSASAPLVLSGGALTCTPASGVVGGCLTSGAQSIAGYKEFVTGGQADLLWSNQSATARAVGSTTQSISELNVHGAQFGGPICSLNDSQSLQFINSQVGNSVTPGEIHIAAYSRDAGGGYYAFNSGANCGGGIGTTMVGIGPEGTVYLAAAPDPVSCGTRADVLTTAGIKEATCASGRQFVQSCDQNYLAVSGDLGSATLGLTEDGGHPAPDGGPYVVLCGSNGGGGTDGGYCWAYLGAHAGMTVISRHPQVGAWALGIENDNGVATSQKWHVGAEGGMGNEHGLTLGNFPPCPAIGVVSYYGGAYYQYAYGAAESELLYASDQHRYYMCSNADGWVKMCLHLPDGGC